MYLRTMKIYVFDTVHVYEFEVYKVYYYTEHTHILFYSYQLITYFVLLLHTHILFYSLAKVKRCRVSLLSAVALFLRTFIDFCVCPLIIGHRPDPPPPSLLEVNVITCYILSRNRI